MKLYTADKETGSFIDQVGSVQEGLSLIAKYEEENEGDRTFEPDFYSIVDENHCEVVTRTWKVYGAEGHRQRESFNKSCYYDFSDEKGTRIIEVLNADKTGTNEYSIIRITRNSYEQCEDEFFGQLTDGIFENSRTGAVVEVI